MSSNKSNKKYILAKVFFSSLVSQKLYDTQTATTLSLKPRLCIQM